MIDPCGFLHALFAHVPPGSIEVRVIESRRGGRVIDRRWYQSAQELVGDFADLNSLSEAKDAGVFFGVLPRKESGRGKSDDTLPGSAAWIDVDFRDFEGGEDEARRILGAFPLPPSIAVFSGHGIHSYWLMREPVEPSALSVLSTRLAAALGGDHVGDAARVMRLPGTSNRKDPSRPIPVVIEQFDSDRLYNPGDFEDRLPPAELKSKVVGAIGDGSVRIGGTLSPRVLHILHRSPKIQDLFEGRGKTALTETGKRTDTTTSGYDYSVVAALARKGIRDESELATVLWLRPDESAKTKGIEYILRTVRRAVSDVDAAEQGAGAESLASIDFSIQRLRVFDSNPRKYEFAVDGAVFAVSTSELLAPARFRVRFMDALGRVPTLPRGSAWTEQVSVWLEAAEIIKQPPEASPSGFLNDAIVRAITELSPGESVDDLDRGKTLHHKGQLVFKTIAIWKFLKENYGEVPSGEICTQLHDLGFGWITPHIDGKGVRVWARTTESPA